MVMALMTSGSPYEVQVGSVMGYSGLPDVRQDTVFSVLFLLLAVPVIVCNLLLLTLIFRTRILRHRHAPFLLSLCASDAMVGVSAVVCNFCRLLIEGQGRAGRGSCLWCMYLSYSAPGTSWFTVFLLTAERFLVLRPVHRLLFSQNNTAVCLSVTWIIIWITGCGIFKWNEYQPDRPCELDWVFPLEMRKLVAALIYTGLILNVAMYFYILRTTGRFLTTVYPDQPIRSRRHVIDGYLHSLILTIIGLLVVCWIPVAVVMTFMRNEEPWFQWVRYISYLLILVSSLANPVIYYMYSTRLTCNLCLCFNPWRRLVNNRIHPQVVYNATEVVRHM